MKRSSILDFFTEPKRLRRVDAIEDDSDSDDADSDDDVPLRRLPSTARRPVARVKSLPADDGANASERAVQELSADVTRCRALASYVRTRGLGRYDTRYDPRFASRKRQGASAPPTASRLHRAVRLRTFAGYGALRTRLGHVTKEEAESGEGQRRRKCITSMAFSSDGVLLVSGDINGGVQLHDFDQVFHDDRVAARASDAVACTSPILSLPWRRAVEQLRWCPWSRDAITVSYDAFGELRLFDLSRCGDDPTHRLLTQSSARRQARGAAGSNGSCEFCFVPHRPNVVVAVDRGATMRLWDVRAGARRGERGVDVTPQWSFSPLGGASRRGGGGAAAAATICPDRDGNAVFCTDGDEVSCWDLRRRATMTFAAKAQPSQCWRRGAIGAMSGVRSLLGSACESIALPQTRREWLHTTTRDALRECEQRREQQQMQAEAAAEQLRFANGASTGPSGPTGRAIKPSISLDHGAPVFAPSAFARAKKLRPPVAKVVGMWSHPQGPSTRLLIAMRGGAVLDVDLCDGCERVVALAAARRAGGTFDSLAPGAPLRASSSAAASAAAQPRGFANRMQRGFIGSSDALVEIVAQEPRRLGGGVGADFRPRDAVSAAQQRHCCTLDATSSLLYVAADGTSTLSCYDIASPLRASPGGGTVPRPRGVQIGLPSAPTALDVHPVLDVVAMAAVDIDGWAQCVVVGARS